MILCTRVKQEAEATMGEQNLPGIDRPYKQALADLLSILDGASGKI